MLQRPCFILPFGFNADLGSYVIAQIGAAFLLVLLLIVLAIGVIHYWASNNFYLTRMQMFFVCFLAFLLALAGFLVGWFEGQSGDALFSLALCLSIFMTNLPLLVYRITVDVRGLFSPYQARIAFLFYVYSGIMTFVLLFCCISDKPFIGASVGYFAFLFLLAGRALTVSGVWLFGTKI